jgi:hypothetical protein
MGKSAPKQPDPYATAQAQGAMNADTARVQATLNRGDTYTPFGSVTNRDMGGDRWRTDVNLSPDQQRLYDQGVQLDTQTGQLALDQIPAVRNLLSQPFARDDADARDRATAGIMSRLEPQFARDREGLEGRLLSQGFQPGTEAYRRAADEHNRAVTDARMQATTAGLGESRAGAAFNNAQRAQQVGELGMLFGLGPGMQMPQGAQMAPVGVNSPDMMGAVQNNYNQRTAQYGANMGAMAGLGAAGLSAGMQYGLPALLALSDRRAKENIERVGELDNGLPVYAYNYKAGGPTHIGLMAQDVEKKNPEAVGRIFGMKGVDYARAVR